MSQAPTIVVTEAPPPYEGHTENLATVQVTYSPRRKRVGNATAPGGIVFISAGMNLAIGLGWTQYNPFGGIAQFCYSWFIGVIIGVILSIPLRKFMSKRNIMAATILLVLIGGIIFTSVPFNYNVLLVARYINGIAVGLITVPFLQLASESAPDSDRALSVAIEQYSITLGIGIQMLYVSLWADIGLSVNRMHGIFDIVIAVIAACLMLLFVESPIDQMRHGKDAEAMVILQRLLPPQSNETRLNANFERCKKYIREQESMTLAESLHQSIAPLLKMLVYRSMMLAFCYNLPMNVALVLSMVATNSTWPVTVAGLCRISGCIITACLVNKVVRKVPSLVYYLIIGALLLGYGSLFYSVGNLTNLTMMEAAQALYVIMQFFVGLYTPYTSIYLSESFPLRVKGYMMDICVIVEQIIQIILIVTASSAFGEAMITLGIIMLVAFVFLIVVLPETRGTSLLEAQRRHKYIKGNSVR